MDYYDLAANVAAAFLNTQDPSQAKVEQFERLVRLILDAMNSITINEGRLKPSDN